MKILSKKPLGLDKLRQLNELPGPTGAPFIGCLFRINRSRMHQQLESWSKKFGSIYRLKLGSKNILIVADHSATSTALRDRPDGFRRTSRFEEIGSELGLLPGVFSTNGDVWQKQRRMVMAGLNPERVRRYYPGLVKVSQRLVNRWSEAARSGKVIDLQSDFMRYTVDAISGLAFGVDVATLQNEEDVIQKHLDKILPALYKRMMSIFPTWRWVRTKSVRELESSMIAINSAVHGFILEARNRLDLDQNLRDNPNNLLESMIIAADDPNSGIDDSQVAGNVLTMLLAGEDTTANTLAWMIDLLWHHPDILARLIDEIRKNIPIPSNPTLEQLEKLDFVEACAQETMRLKPVAPVIALQALRDTVVGDVHLPSGSIIINLMRSDCVSEQHLPCAKHFRPERWLGESGFVAGDVKRVTMPFGAGPRICPGRYLALLEIKMAMVALFGNFNIENVWTPDGRRAAEKLSFSMMPVGLSLKLQEIG